MKNRIPTLLLSLLVCGAFLTGCTPASELPVSSESPESFSSAPSESPENPDIIPGTYAYSLTVRINPETELYFDERDTVVGVAYLNEDAKKAYRDVDLMGSTLSQSMHTLITAAADGGYLKADAQVEISLSGVSEESKTSFDPEILTEAFEAASKSAGEMVGEGAVSVETSVSEDLKSLVEEKTPKICPDCSGTGNDCKECGGTGIVNCKRCENGIESCGTCKGSGIIKCHGCHGNGGDCSYCGGTGKMTCDACNGQEKFTCSWCKGALRHVCPDCEGKGTCKTCGGDGKVSG